MQRAFNRDVANRVPWESASPTPAERYVPLTPVLTPLPGTNLSAGDIDPELVPLPPSVNPSMVYLGSGSPGYFDIPVDAQAGVDGREVFHCEGLPTHYQDLTKHHQELPKHYQELPLRLKRQGGGRKDSHVSEDWETCSGGRSTAVADENESPPSFGYVAGLYDGSGYGCGSDTSTPVEPDEGIHDFYLKNDAARSAREDPLSAREQRNSDVLESIYSAYADGGDGSGKRGGGDAEECGEAGGIRP